MENNISSSLNPKRRFGCMQVFGLLLAAVVLTALVTFWAVRAYIFPSDFTPVTLSAAEGKVLDAKLKSLDFPESAGKAGVNSDTTKISEEGRNDSGGGLKPEPYSEDGSDREISLTEKELNALLAKNTDLAKKLALDLSDNLISAKLLLPVDEDFPFFGGKTLRVRAGAELAFKDGMPVVVMKGVSVMGVPIPNAWLGGLKNIDLVKEFGQSEGFWKTFSAGIDYIKVEEGFLKIKLKE